MKNLKEARNILDTALEATNCNPCDYELYQLKEAMVTILDALETKDTDFYLDMSFGDVRLILKSEIDAIQCEELESDLYTLGCFNAWFIADVLDLDTETIESMQQAEAYEGIGKLIMNCNKIDELQEEYVRHDGYGHHFSSYDGEEHEAGEYYIFRVN